MRGLTYRRRRLARLTDRSTSGARLGHGRARGGCGSDGEQRGDVAASRWSDLDPTVQIGRQI